MENILITRGAETFVYIDRKKKKKIQNISLLMF